MEKERIKFADFLEIEKKLELMVGEVVYAKRIEKTDKLLHLNVSFGNGEIRQVVTNIGEHVTPESLLYKKYVFVTNLEPTKIKGIESTAMIVPGNVSFEPVNVTGQTGTLML